MLWSASSPYHLLHQVVMGGAYGRSPLVTERETAVFPSIPKNHPYRLTGKRPLQTRPYFPILSCERKLGWVENGRCQQELVVAKVWWGERPYFPHSIL
ncbi:MAG: hypothetical protein IPM53_03450 [Anaerolineaceae bacterium]|nr:hypothetical protein [Anaerolineaceae bacterium]